MKLHVSLANASDNELTRRASRLGHEELDGPRGSTSAQRRRTSGQRQSARRRRRRRQRTWRWRRRVWLHKVLGRSPGALAVAVARWALRALGVPLRPLSVLAVWEVPPLERARCGGRGGSGSRIRRSLGRKCCSGGRLFLLLIGKGSRVGDLVADHAQSVLDGVAKFRFDRRGILERPGVRVLGAHKNRLVDIRGSLVVALEG